MSGVAVDAHKPNRIAFLVLEDVCDVGPITFDPFDFFYDHVGLWAVLHFFSFGFCSGCCPSSRSKNPRSGRLL
jgi:hypothetical protein